MQARLAIVVVVVRACYQVLHPARHARRRQPHMYVGQAARAARARVGSRPEGQGLRRAQLRAVHRQAQALVQPRAHRLQPGLQRLRTTLHCTQGALQGAHGLSAGAGAAARTCACWLRYNPCCRDAILHRGKRGCVCSVQAAGAAAHAAARALAAAGPPEPGPRETCTRWRLQADCQSTRRVANACDGALSPHAAGCMLIGEARCTHALGIRRQVGISHCTMIERAGACRASPGHSSAAAHLRLGRRQRLQQRDRVAQGARGKV